MTTPANTPMYEYLVEAISLSISDEELDHLERFAHAHYAGEARRTLDAAIAEQRRTITARRSHAASGGASVPSDRSARR